MDNYDDIKANYDDIKEECDSINFRLFKLIKRKDRYQSKVSDTQESIVEETIKLTACQKEVAKLQAAAAQLQAAAAQPQEAAAAAAPDIGGKRRHTKRYKKSKKPKRRFTRSKIRV
jgi:chromosome segregation ATPase